MKKTKKQKNKKSTSRIFSKRSFSLAEVMVAVSIVGILTVVAIVLMSGDKQDQQLETDMRQLAAVIRETQNYTLSGKQPDPATKACGFGLYAKNIPLDSFNLEYIEYGIYYNTADLVSGNCGSTQEYRQYDPNLVKSKILSTFNVQGRNALRFSGGGMAREYRSFYFETPLATLYDDYGVRLEDTQWIPIAVTNMDTGKCSRVIIYATGKVEEIKSCF